MWGNVRTGTTWIHTNASAQDARTNFFKTVRLQALSYVHVSAKQIIATKVSDMNTPPDILLTFLTLRGPGQSQGLMPKAELNEKTYNDFCWK